MEPCGGVREWARPFGATTCPPVGFYQDRRSGAPPVGFYQGRRSGAPSPVLAVGASIRPWLVLNFRAPPADLPKCERQCHHRAAAPGRVGCPPGGTLYTETTEAIKNPRKKSRKCCKKIRKSAQKNLRISPKENRRFAPKKKSKSDIFCFVNRRSGFPNLECGDECRPAGKVAECSAGGSFRS